jgi:membrane peptidoglycan carboxypeptidase
LMRPRLLLGFGNAGDGRLTAALTPEPVRRVVTEDTSRRLKELLVGVVERGTGRRAHIPGYRVAGKTGTAQKAVRGGYSKTDYIASFVGFAPADAPELTTLVILASPTGDHSGSRAAAVFARIVSRSLHYLGVAPQAERQLRVAKLWPQSRPIVDMEGLRLVEGRDRLQTFGTRRIDGGGRASEPRSRVESGVPDVVGLPARDALAMFVLHGVVPEIIGTGNVIEQYPAPGKRVEPGARARLRLGEQPTAPLESVPMLRPSGPVTVAGQLAAGDRRLATRQEWNEIDTRHR